MCALRSAGGAGEDAPRRRGSRLDEPAAYHAEGLLYLTPDARFDILALPEGANAGKTVNEAMRDIEHDNPQLAGVLPKTYEIFTSTLLKELLKRVPKSPPPSTTTLSAVSTNTSRRICPERRVKRWGVLHSGRHRPAVGGSVGALSWPLLDPACGSGGMFVQSARFVSEHKKDPRGVVDPRTRKGRRDVALCRMNLAMHGLEGDISEAITYYDDLHNSTGRFDFVLANPPFNVNAVDKERLEADVGKGRRYPVRTAAHGQRELSLDSTLLLRAE